MASKINVDKIARGSGTPEFTIPTADGTAGQAIVTNASGVLSFADAGPSLTGSTNNTIVTITGANALAGETNFTYDGNSVGIKNDGTASSVYLYCEQSNAHYTSIKSAAHSAYTGGSWTMTLPGTDGAANEFLQTNGAGLTSWAAGSGFHQQLVKTASDTTYSPAAGVTKIIIEAVGGGGGSSNTGGSKGVTGAAGGGYARVSLAVTSATVINIQIGTAGAAGVGSEGVGQDGGATTVTYVSGGSSFTPAISANGGEKGTIAAGVQPTTDGGTATGPTGGLYIQGEMGAAWCANDSNQWGGGSMLGTGGRPLSTGNPRAQLGTGYGAGASGANEGTGEGDPGTAGVVIITEYK